MKRLLLFAVIVCVSAVCLAKNVTIKATDRPASEVFRSIVEQTGKNFVYSSDLLAGMKVTVDVKDKPLDQALSQIFRGTDIEYKVKGKNIILKKKAKDTPQPRKKPQPKPAAAPQASEVPRMLEEVTVVSRLEDPAVETADIGAMKLTAKEISGVPTLFGESDVMKALQMQPGISGGAEGMAEMHVHGGNADENLIMLDNVPLYQANHFAGLFSAFNIDATRYIDFFKSSIPAKYDGRLSSYLDVRTKNGSHDRHHGSFKLGISSGALFIEGPIKEKTTYMVALRRSWFDLLTWLGTAIVNSRDGESDVSLGYAFTDLNGKITHRFSDNVSGFASIYFGHDYLMSGEKDEPGSIANLLMDDKYKLNWGNIVGQLGVNWRMSEKINAEFTGAYTRFFTSYTHDYKQWEKTVGTTPESNAYEESSAYTSTDNHINDYILRGDFDWRPDEANRVRFGGGYTLHSFLPGATASRYTTPAQGIETRDSAISYTASEANIYIEDDWKMSEKFRMNAGIHGSLFNIDGKTHFGIGPRLSLSYRPSENWAVKGAYTRTNQYVHQLTTSYLALPTDQWVPITGDIKPQSADKVAVGGYWQSDDAAYTVSVEGYYKYMRNLIDFRDEYYLMPPFQTWDKKLCTGKGSAKGIDVKIEKTSGKITGHVAYSLGWADRTFPDKNGGRTFPARFDNRHTINVLLNWNISDKVKLNAAWTGHSGNRFTLLTQVWDNTGSPLKASINNYQLPFYHRLDLSLTVTNKRGFWNFSLYNAYCHMNTVAVRRSFDKNGNPVFQKVKMLPIIPSISYTWQF